MKRYEYCSASNNRTCRLETQPSGLVVAAVATNQDHRDVRELFSEEQIVKIEGARSGPKIAAQPGGDGGQILFVQKPTPHCRCWHRMNPRLRLKSGGILNALDTGWQQ